MYRISWKAARVNRGLTLKSAAKMSGRSVDTIQKYEKDSSNIPRDLMVALLNIYQVPVDMVFCGVESDLIGTFEESLTGRSEKA